MAEYNSLTALSQSIHAWAHRKGFYTGEHRPPCVHVGGNRLAVLMLVVTELGEAAEAIRRDDESNFREEIADAIIRLLDLAAADGMDIHQEIEDKMAFNEQRPVRHGKVC